MRTGEAGRFELAVRSDAMLTDTVSDAVLGLAAGEGATSRIRLILEGSGSVPRLRRRSGAHGRSGAAV